MIRSIPTLALGLFLNGALAAQTTALPVNGPASPGMEAFDEAMIGLLQKYRLPGASLAVVDNGRLVLARGYGWADREANVAAQPFQLFRVASLSKTFTAVATLKLVQEGKLRLDDRLMTILPDLQPGPGQTLDPRYREVTIRQLLHHTFGSNSARNGDPMFQWRQAQTLFGGAPHSIANMTRYGFGLPLHADPGTVYAYSNLGYMLLGRVVEKVSGRSYEEYVRQEVFAPLGVTTARIGRSLLSQRYTDEVRYYDFEGAATVQSLVPGVTGNVPRPYGGAFLTEVAESWGGWVISAVDLMRYVTGLDGRRQGLALLTPATRSLMFSRPAAPLSQTSAVYYGLGWNVRPVNNAFTYFHSGSLAGTRTNLVTFANGRSYTVLFNSRPRESDQAVAEGAADAFLQEVETNINAAFSRVTRWPTEDLFPRFARESINASAEQLTFNWQVGTAGPAAQTLNLTASGGGTIWMGATVAAGAPWLRLDRAGSFTPAALAVSVNPAGLTPGTYTSSIQVVSADAANSPRTVRVELRVFGEVMVRNAATRVAGPVAPGSLAVADGTGFTEGLTARLDEAEVTIASQQGNRVSFVVPAEAAPGERMLTIRTAGAEVRGMVTVAALAPGLFSAAETGEGAALAEVVRIGEDGTETVTPAYECGAEGCRGLGIVLGESGALLRLAATGIRGTDSSGLAVKIGEETVEIVSATPAAAERPGIDLITVRIPAAFAGRGELQVVLSAGEATSNAVRVRIE